VNVRNILRRSARLNADRIAVVADGRRLSYHEVWERGLRFAGGLSGYGLRPQDKVAILENNGLAALDSYVGCAAANVVRVPLYARNARRGHLAMLNNTGARVLIVDAALAHEVSGLEDEAPALERIVVRDEGYEDWLLGQPAVDPDPVIDDRDLFIIRHTGGTTGLPKAVAITHRCWASAARDWFYPLPPPAPGDPIIHVGPLSHASGYTLLPVFAAGGVQVPASGLGPDELVRLMQRERIAYGLLPPSLLNVLCRVPGIEDLDWSFAKCYFTGSAPISEATIELARRTFGDACLYQLFGQTEAIPVAGMGPAEWFAEDLPGTNPKRACGRVLPWVDIEIRGEANEPLPLGEIGEIAVKCDGQFEGFYGAPEDTAERLVDGWVLMGDVGRIDEHGYLYLVDRKNDMIVSGGFNLYPGEIENVIASHLAVVEVAVFGIPHERWGETPMAVCTVDPDQPVDEQEIVDLVARTLGSYQKPTRVELRTEPLPKSPVGKLMRRALRDPYWQDQERLVAGA
jgi:acyl-CoA synthetase (AMP-forming)/AMP-acid ligase II